MEQAQGDPCVLLEAWGAAAPIPESPGTPHGSKGSWEPLERCWSHRGSRQRHGRVWGRGFCQIQWFLLRGQSHG